MSDPSEISRTGAAIGIHISKGVTPRIPIGGLVIGIGPDGKPTGSATLELQLDTCIYWLEIAFENLLQAKIVRDELLRQHASGITNFVELDREFKACVQASVAAATFFEALYAAVLERMPTKPSVKGKTRNQSTARYAVVTEALRQAFGLRVQGTANLRNVLKEIYRFRNEAVHPSVKFTDPILHPELGVGVERRFIMFGFDSTLKLVRAALAFSKMLVSRDLTRKPKSIQDFATYLLTVSEPLYKDWELTFGPLFEPAPPAS